jgi:hypothetical protein
MFLLTLTVSMPKNDSTVSPAGIQSVIEQIEIPFGVLKSTSYETDHWVTIISVTRNIWLPI